VTGGCHLYDVGKEGEENRRERREKEGADDLYDLIFSYL
jgi:hypothetical protein